MNNNTSTREAVPVARADAPRQQKYQNPQALYADNRCVTSAVTPRLHGPHHPCFRGADRLTHQHYTHLQTCTCWTQNHPDWHPIKSTWASLVFVAQKLRVVAPVQTCACVDLSVELNAAALEVLRSSIERAAEQAKEAVRAQLLRELDAEEEVGA